jgi:cysteine desulfurase
MDRIYLDHNATTPPDPRVAQAMQKALSQTWGNPSSMHWFGQQADNLLEQARENVARLLNAPTEEIFFTSGGTEADNLAVIGSALAQKDRRRVVTSAIEHPAVRAACKRLSAHGFEIHETPVNENGIIDLEDLADAVTDNTALVTIMAANNETGVIQPLDEIGKIAGGHGALFHTDAVQWAGKLPMDVKTWPADLVSISSHKFYGPKGAGALWIRKGVAVNGRQFGGGQESGIRTGTENMPGIAGLGEAARIALEEQEEWNDRIRGLRGAFEDAVLEKIEDAHVLGDLKLRVPNTSCIAFPGAEGEAVLISLDLKGIAVSTGSACSSGAAEPSHVLMAMGLDPLLTNSAIRFSFGKDNSMDQVEKTVATLCEMVERVRSISGGMGPVTSCKR